MKVTATRTDTFQTSTKSARVVIDTGEHSFLRERKNGRELVVGIGMKRSAVTMRHFHVVVRLIIRTAKAHGLTRLGIAFDELVFTHLELPEREIAEMIARNACIADYEFDAYRKDTKKSVHHVRALTILGAGRAEVREGLKRGHAAGEEVNGARTLSNTPGGEMTPALLAREAQKVARRTGLQARILNEKDIKKIGMGGVLGVSQGSTARPRFIILEHKKGKTNEKPLVFVGKGVTFDTGGINLKPSQNIGEMHMDMSGGAAVIHTLALAARWGIKKHIIGLVPAVENMPSGSSYRPHDIIRSLSGKTIEVLNTDAEGRVILADALTYAKRYTPKVVVDVATLTGASIVALGQRASAVFSKEDDCIDTLMNLSEKSGDPIWRLPLWDEYKPDIKGTFGDVVNAPRSAYGGAIAAAMFLSEFADGYPWVHIDIAPRMVTIEGDGLAKGAAGAPVALLGALCESRTL